MRFAIKAPWQHTRCIICLQPSELTEEHVIPEALGGRLTCHFLCVTCNSRLGHEVEGLAKADPTIRILTAKLAKKIPRLAGQLIKGQECVSSGPGGLSRGRIKNSEFAVRSQKLPDGSLLQPTPLAANTIRRILERERHDELSISHALRRLKDAPENTRVLLTQTLEVVKWSIESIQPTLDGPLLNLVVPLKIAYEFLALHLNDAVYQNLPALAAVRSALASNSIDTTHLLIERLHAPIANPFHGIVFEGNDPHATVQVRLFGQLAFRIHFKTLSVGGPRFVYTHDLIDNEEHVALAGESEDGA